MTKYPLLVKLYFPLHKKATVSIKLVKWLIKNKKLFLNPPWVFIKCNSMCTGDLKAEGHCPPGPRPGGQCMSPELGQGSDGRLSYPGLDWPFCHSWGELSVVDKLLVKREWFWGFIFLGVIKFCLLQKPPPHPVTAPLSLLTIKPQLWQIPVPGGIVGLESSPWIASFHLLYRWDRWK